MKRTFVAPIVFLSIAISGFAGDVNNPVSGDWKGKWNNAPITVKVKVEGPNQNDKRKTNLTGTLNLPPVDDPLRSKDGPKQVTPASDFEGTIDAKGLIRLTMTFPDLEGRSQPETFSGKLTKDKETKQDTLMLTSAESKTVLTLKHP